jgi:GNAT superfamily N-acetyltransferase
VILGVLTTPTDRHDAPPVRDEGTAAPRDRARSRRAAEALLDVPAAWGGWGAFLDEAARADVRRFLQRCREDLALHGAGRNPDKGVKDLLRSLPRQGLDERRLLAGLFGADGELLAMIDAVRGALDESAWVLSGLLVRPDVRGRGIAAALLEALEEWVGAQGGRVIHFPVQRRNRQALQFARRSGFTLRAATTDQTSAADTSFEQLVRDVA